MQRFSTAFSLTSIARITKWIAGLDDVDISEDGSVLDAEIAAEPKKLDTPDEPDVKEKVESSEEEGADENGEEEEQVNHFTEPTLTL